jgi:SAM-dependent methyltransferase
MALKIANPKQFCQILNNKKVVDFVKSLIIHNYLNFFDDEKKINLLVDQAFHHLTKTQQSKCDIEKIEKIANFISRKIFKKDDENFWFNKGYQRYKAILKPNNQLETVEPYLNAKKILDFGCGRGYLANSLLLSGYHVCCTDVLDRRTDDVKHLLFRKMADPTVIPFEDNEVDIAIVSTVLHHIHNAYLPSLISELCRVSKRLIIIEDLPYIENSDFNDTAFNGDINYKRFRKLTEIERVQSCQLMDFFGNVIAQGVLEMNFPFEFKSVNEWVSTFSIYGFNLDKVDFLGFSDNDMHSFFKVVMVFDRTDCPKK